MFSIPTLPKLLLVALVIVAVWWFFRRGQASVRTKGNGQNSGTRRTENRDAKRIEDMVQCSKCGAYVPAGSASCGKDNCPF